MPDETFEQEDLLESESYDEVVLSSDQVTQLGDKLDRIEALLNEEISHYDQEQMATGSGSQSIMLTTGSGVSDPNYSQYIYDLLTDSTVKVQIVEEDDIVSKPLNQYSVGSSLQVIIIILLLIIIADHFIHDYVFKFHRR